MQGIATTPATMTTTTKMATRRSQSRSSIGAETGAAENSGALVAALEPPAAAETKTSDAEERLSVDETSNVDPSVSLGILSVSNFGI